ncbi:hypothetical protein ACTNEY_09335 [Fusicatenibacter saccharivorans]|uniref:hypothetical protein n=1 Tax=Fusicatenibacter saccharivorans TaxID=1150298 RepID=UPI003F8C6106
MDTATAITVDAAADLFSVLPDVRAEKAPGADQPPRGFFSPEFSFSETVSVSVLLFPVFHLFSFFFFSHTFQIYFIKGIPFEYLFSFCCFFSIHFPAVSFFFLPLIICFFPPSVIFSGLEHKIKRNKKTNAGMLPGRILI